MSTESRIALGVPSSVDNETANEARRKKSKQSSSSPPTTLSSSVSSISLRSREARGTGARGASKK